MIILTNQLNHINFAILKHFAYCKIFYVIFYLHKFISRQFFILRICFLLKILRLPILLLKWNETCYIDFFQSRFCQFCLKTILVLLFLDKEFRAIVNIQMCKFRFKEGLKLVKYPSHKLISFIYSKLCEVLSFKIHSNSSLSTEISKDVF